MELTMKLMKIKYLKLAICLTLCLASLALTWYMDYQEVHAFVPALVLAGFAIPEAVTVVSTLLVAAGLTWAFNEGMDAVSNWFYSSAVPAIKQEVSNMITTASNGFASVSDDLWNYTRDWVQDHFTTGENTKSVNYHEYPMDTETVPFTAGTAETTEVYPISSCTLNGKTYSVVRTDYATYSVINLTVNGNTKNAGGTLYASSITISKTSDFIIYLNTNAQGTSGLYVAARYIPYGSTTYMDNAYWYAIPDTTTLTDSIVSNQTKAVNVTGTDVLSNPTWDIKDESGTREIAYPGTLDDLVGKTYDDITNPEETTVPGELSGPWWDTLLRALFGPIYDWFSRIFSSIGAWAQSIINAITGVRDAVAEADETGRIRQYKIPDLLILILQVILACIRLILRALVFIATLPAIPADAGDINADFLSGVNFLKNQQIPFFGISLWNMATGVIAIFFGLAVVRRIRRLYSV